MDPDEIKALLKSGIDAARNNNVIIARSIFQQVLDAEPRNELAWMWLAQVSDNTDQRRQALEEVLAINPRNEKALLALEKLQTGTGSIGPASSPSRMGDTTFRRTAGTTGQAPSQQQQQMPNYLRPVQRQQLPGEIWASSRRDKNQLGLLLTGAVALALIGLAVYLLVLRITEDDDEQAAANPTGTVDIFALSATPTVPTATRTPRRPFGPITVTQNTINLPATWTPSPTWTPLPSPTWTPEPPGLNLYRLVFSGNQTPGEPFELYLVQADNTDLERIEIALPQLDSAEEPVEEPTEAPTEEGEVSEGEEGEGESEPQEEPTEAPEPSPNQILDPAISPDGSQIVFTGQSGFVQELFIMDYPNGTPRQLTHFGTDQTYGAVWSPDGAAILFSSNTDGDHDIYLLQAGNESAVPVNLTNNELITDRDPAWSPDGSRFAFASDRIGLGQLEIFVAPLQGEELCQMTDSSNSSFSPVWSPDGSRIAFITNRNNDNDLYIMRADGASERVLSVNDGDWQERDPAWSPDGRWLIVSSNREDRPTTMWLVSADGETWQRLREQDGEARDAQWLRNELAIGPSPDFEFNCAR